MGTKIRKGTLPKQFTRAALDPATFDRESRTIEVVWSTGARVLRSSWIDGQYYEELSMEPSAIRMERLTSGAPVLDNHDRWAGVRGHLGVVESATVENGEGRATLKLSGREDMAPVLQDIADGIIRNVSVGYFVHRMEKIEDGEGEIPVYRATDWEPYEISFVPVGADAKAQARADNDGEHPVEIITTETNTGTHMNEEQIRRLRELAGQRSLTAEEEGELTKLRALAAEHGVKVEEGGAPEGQRNADPAPDRQRAEGADNADEAHRAAAEAIRNERRRVAEITSAVRAAGLEQSFADTLIENGTNIDRARALIIEEFAKGDPARGTRAQVTMGADERDKLRDAMTDGLLLRAGVPGDMSAERQATAREFRGMTLMDMARESLERENISTRGLTRREIAMAALGLTRAGYQSSSDFPAILANSLNKTLRAAYQNMPRTFQPWTRRATASDFRDIIRTQFGADIDLKAIPEGGEYGYSGQVDGKEIYKVVKYGSIIAVTWETLINDDLNAFSRTPQQIAAKAAQKQSDIVYGLLLENPKMSDGSNLFSVSNHANTVTTGTVINIDSLAAARAAMRKQKDLGGDFINVTPRYLIVGPDKEQEALQFLSNAYQPNTQGQINPYTGLMEPIVEARVTGNQWYVSADPAQVDTLEYAFLAGEEELFTEQREGFERDGLEWKVRMVFGAGVIDFRGLYKNPGAAPE